MEFIRLLLNEDESALIHRAGFTEHQWCVMLWKLELTGTNYGDERRRCEWLRAYINKKGL